MSLAATLAAPPATAGGARAVSRLLFIGGGHRFWGMEQALLMLEAALVRRGIACTHVTGGWSDGRFAAALESHGVRAVPVKLGRLYWRHPMWTVDTLRQLPASAKTLRALVAAENPDAIVHLDNRIFLTSYPVFAGLGRAHVYREAVVPGVGAIDVTTYRMVFAACRAVVVNSVAVRDAFLRLGFDADRLVLVENGTDCEALRPRPRERHSGPVRVGIVGQVIPRKGHDVLLDALQVLVARGRDVQLVVIGDDRGPFGDALKQRAAEHGLADRIEWAGVISDKSAIYHQLDLVAVPSRSDAFPNVAIEAGAAGLPVVGSRSGGLEAAVADGVTGFVVPSESPPALADALDRLISDPALRADMGAAARRRVEAHYSAGRMAEDFVAAIEAALGYRACA